MPRSLVTVPPFISYLDKHPTRLVGALPQYSDLEGNAAYRLFTGNTLTSIRNQLPEDQQTLPVYTTMSSVDVWAQRYYGKNIDLSGLGAAQFASCITFLDALNYAQRMDGRLLTPGEIIANPLIDPLQAEWASDGCVYGHQGALKFNILPSKLPYYHSPYIGFRICS